MNFPTPHIQASRGDFASTVLMPGDPLRSKFIAENFLTGAVLVNNVRGVQGYTGTYKGTRVSVMASGMGMPSIGIYSYELYTAFGVENILRVGTAGTIRKDIPVRDIVIGMGASTNSNFAVQYALPGVFAPLCSYRMLRECTLAAEEMGLRYHVGNVLSSDTYYGDTDSVPAWSKMGIMAIEMEAAALYMNAARLGKNALAICTISNNILTGEETSSEERQTAFTSMMELALQTAKRLG